MDDEILVPEFGLYQPKYEMLYADDYKDRLRVIRDKQKFMIKNKSRPLRQQKLKKNRRDN